MIAATGDTEVEMGQTMGPGVEIDLETEARVEMMTEMTGRSGEMMEMMGMMEMMKMMGMMGMMEMMGLRVETG